MCHQRCKNEDYFGECRLNPDIHILPCLFDEEEEEIEEEIEEENWEDSWR